MACLTVPSVSCPNLGGTENGAVRMNKVIALSGVHDSGKTSVLLGLLAKLKGAQRVLPQSNTTSVPVAQGSDQREVLQYYTAIGTVTIGVCTGGDTKKIIQDNFAFFNGNKCDIGITACRSTAASDTVKEVIAQSGNVIPFFVAKMQTSPMFRQQVDSHTVDQLVAMIP